MDDWDGSRSYGYRDRAISWPDRQARWGPSVPGVGVFWPYFGLPLVSFSGGWGGSPGYDYDRRYYDQGRCSMDRCSRCGCHECRCQRSQEQKGGSDQGQKLTSTEEPKGKSVEMPGFDAVVLPE